METAKTNAREPILFRWRKAIMNSNLPSTQRYVLHVVGFHMNGDGGECFPSTKLLARETGLSERTVVTHLMDARKKGWLRVTERREGKAWKHHSYTPGFPQGTEADSAPKGVEGASPPAEALNLTHDGTESDDMKALKEVQSSTSVSTSGSSQCLLRFQKG